jgi:hypothetical protein
MQDKTIIVDHARQGIPLIVRIQSSSKPIPLKHVTKTCTILGIMSTISSSSKGSLKGYLIWCETRLLTLRKEEIKDV